MRKTPVFIIAVAAVWILMSSMLNKNMAQTQIARYETPVFSAQFPTSGQVRASISKTNGLHSYLSNLPNRDELAILYFDSEKPDLRIHNSMRGAPGFLDDIFKPGYSTDKIDGKTISNLPAWEFIASGIEKSSSEPYRCRTRIAVSSHGFRHWMLWVCSFDKSDKLLEANSEKFFDSFKIK